jgi:hypothetical protein
MQIIKSIDPHFSGFRPPPFFRNLAFERVASPLAVASGGRLPFVMLDGIEQLFFVSVVGLLIEVPIRGRATRNDFRMCA